MRVVLFSGGRGSRVLSSELIRDPRIELCVLVNGYDDGMSTGEVRRFLGGCLGPSDFRKNAARLAKGIGCASESLTALIELRTPKGYGADGGRRCVDLMAGAGAPDPADAFQVRVAELARGLADRERADIAPLCAAFGRALDAPGATFDHADCSLGNLVLGGAFLAEGRDFNRALARFNSLCGLPAGMILNVSDGGDAHLVGMDCDGRLLPGEAEIVAASGHKRIEEIYLLPERLEPADAERLQALPREKMHAELRARCRVPVANPVALDVLRAADLVVYAPGTQYSSLFPSYLTPGVGRAIAANLSARKILITNLQEDADIAGADAVDLVRRATHYLREEGKLTVPAPCLITHFLINDPGVSAREAYVPLGAVERIEDPRLVRIADFEEGASGRHEATKVLGPFIESFVREEPVPRVALALLGTRSPDKLVQSLIEMARGGIGNERVDVHAFYEADEDLDADFVASLPLRVSRRAPSQIVESEHDYVVLFDSSGMYRGEDVVDLLARLQGGRLDAVWGSRRLSVRDIRFAYRLLHRASRVSGAVSWIGSHVLSLACLVFYGRYISDTLSGIRVVRTHHAAAAKGDLAGPLASFRVLASVLGERAEILEVPIRYFPISPDKVRRVRASEGLAALWILFTGVFRRRRDVRSESTPVRGAAVAAPEPRA